MIKQREGHKVIFSDIANQRIKDKQCPTCGKPKAEWKRRTDWRCCCSECTDRFWQEFVTVRSWQDLRAKCFKRDNYTCKRCGQRPVPTKIEFIQNKDENGQKLFKDRGEWFREERVIENPTIEDFSSFLIGDHIIPIALGGAEWDINNLQTLCKVCNRIKTRADAAKIALQREIDKKTSKNHTLQSF